MTVLVIGAGPAGLMAAEVISEAAIPVVVAEAMPTPARKFLMAGKSGLNLTKDQPATDFSRYFTGSCAGLLGVADFGPLQVRDWAEGLGVPLFTGSTGRVFPVGMKASPLLRAWLTRLAGRGVQMRPSWRWTGAGFDTPDGPQHIAADAVVLALGGASWPKLGSDGAWQALLAAQGVDLVPLKPANMGFHAAWSDQMARHFGAAVKGTAIRAGEAASRGEWVISTTGIEGGGIYETAASIRDGAMPLVDLAPDISAGELAHRLARAPAKQSLGNRLRRVLGDPVRAALLVEWGKPLPTDPAALAGLAKALPMRLTGPMDMARAISSAGGISASALSPMLELRAMPGTFAAGEMLDWEAPTGGYLLTGCLASGRVAGRGVLDYLSRTRTLMNG